MSQINVNDVSNENLKNLIEKVYNNYDYDRVSLDDVVRCNSGEDFERLSGIVEEVIDKEPDLDKELDISEAMSRIAESVPNKDNVAKDEKLRDDEFEL